MAVDQETADFEVDEDLLEGVKAWSEEHGLTVPTYDLDKEEDRARLKRVAQSLKDAKRQKRG